MTILEAALGLADAPAGVAFFPGWGLFLTDFLERDSMVGIFSGLLEIIAHLVLHHFFGVEVPLALQSLDRGVGNIVHIALGRGATAQGKQE
jgi:hypothetical protein